MASRRARRGSGVPGGREVGCERAQTGGSDLVDEGARVRQDGADGFRVVRDRCLSVLPPPNYLAVCVVGETVPGDHLRMIVGTNADAVVAAIEQRIAELGSG